MKIFAFYLPQFYETDYNNEWWGKGFTEWTHVSKAQKLYKGHNQPKVPLNNNYYNLLDEGTVKWETSLMHKYGVDGFVYYHYFSEGKLLLEKPAEKLLKNKDINQPFFFCWANHSWYKAMNGKKDLLMEQKYGKEEMWEKHFLYLLPFFKDERYEKKDNKPLFMIFNTNFAEREKMMNYFNKRCIENGFDGISIIYTASNSSEYKTLKNNIRESDFIHLRQPSYSLYDYKHTLIGIIKVFMKRIANFLGRDKIRYVEKYNGNGLFHQIMKQPKGNQVLPGLFCEWDNTPRHSYRGYIISAPNKKLFMKYLTSISNDKYVFFNAWNEWAEGMVLEPTVENNFKYLEWIKESKTFNKKNNCRNN